MTNSIFVIFSIILAISVPAVYGQESSISIAVEKSKYFEGEQVQISGSVSKILFGTEVSLLIIHPSGDIISINKLMVDTNKKFQINIETDNKFFESMGTYTVLARYGHEDTIAKDTFSLEPPNKLISKNESKQNILLNFDFIHPTKQKIQEHIDYKITVTKNGQTVFGPTPLTYSSSGSVSLPMVFSERELHDVKIEVTAVMFQPIPSEKASFRIMTGSDTIFSEYTSNNSLKINMAINKTPSIEPKIVPDWIKNNAKWWSDGQIDDSSFTSSIQYLISEKILDIPDLPYPASWMDKDVPSWVKNNAKWWADDLIEEEDFIKGIKYLVEKGVIQVNQV